MAGDTYTILVSGQETGGRYCLIDMTIPQGGGPGSHHHDFEEMFQILEGEIEFTFRDEKHTAKGGMTVNIPANAPHSFTNKERGSAGILCMSAPAGLEEFFLAISTLIASRTTPALKQAITVEPPDRKLP